MDQDSSARNSPDGINGVPRFDDHDPDSDSTGPVLPIILIGAACGIAAGVVGFYVAYNLLRWDITTSVFVSVLALSLGLGVAGAGLSALTGSRATLANITLSCGLIVAVVLFFGLCTLVGALAATLLLMGK